MVIRTHVKYKYADRSASSLNNCSKIKDEINTHPVDVIMCNRRILNESQMRPKFKLSMHSTSLLLYKMN